MCPVIAGLTPDMWLEVGFVMFFLFAMVAVYFIGSWWLK